MAAQPVAGVAGGADVVVVAVAADEVAAPLAPQRRPADWPSARRAPTCDLVATGAGEAVGGLLVGLGVGLCAFALAVAVALDR